jgi:hypothetical protein
MTVVVSMLSTAARAMSRVKSDKMPVRAVNRVVVSDSEFVLATTARSISQAAPESDAI